MLAATFTAAGTSSDTRNTVSALVTFDKLPDGSLEVDLTNTSPNPLAIRRGDILTGVLWDSTGRLLRRSPRSRSAFPR